MNQTIYSLVGDEQSHIEQTVHLIHAGNFEFLLLVGVGMGYDSVLVLVSQIKL